jgi:HD superfamily phosphohydrolase
MTIEWLDEFCINLKKKYLEKFEDKGEEEWASEREIIKEIISVIQNKIEFRYKIIEPINVEETCVIILVYDKIWKIPLDLKFPRPGFEKISTFTEVLAKKIEQLKKAQPSITLCIYDDYKIESAELPLLKLEIPFPFYIKQDLIKFYNDMEKKYIGESKKEEEKNKRGKEWEDENQKIKEIIPVIQNKINPRYKITEPLAIGGTSVIILVYDRTLEITSSLKFPRPKIEKITAFAEVIKEEIKNLKKARHPNIVHIYDDFKIKPVELPLLKLEIPFPFYIMEYVHGAKDFEKFLKESEEIKKITLFKIIEQIARGIEKLHLLGIVHLDIKLENMLIPPDGKGDAKLSDLGSARLLPNGKDDEQELCITLDDRWVHPELEAEFKKLYRTEHARTRGKIKRKVLKKSFDLYSFGKNLHRLLKCYTPEKWKDFEVYDKNYLELLACRLLDGRPEAREYGLGLHCEIYKEICYKQDEIGIVIEDIKKITGEYSIYQKIPEIDPFNAKTLNTSNSRPTPFTLRLKKVIECKPFLRLAYVSQLGFANLVYPTATNSRLEHILGTYSNIARYCDALYNDPINPLFKQIMNENDIKSVLLAALFHDIGQYPLAHDLEEAEPLFSHEDLTKEILSNSLNNPEITKLLDFVSKKEDGWGISSDRIKDIIKADPNNYDCKLKDRILHTLIDCPIDADKLDYIIRDSNNLGLTIGRSIDIERFFRTITIVFGDKKGKNLFYASLGIHEKGKVQAENLAFARYVLFGAVYWHHALRIIKAMLHQAVWEIFYSNKEIDKDKFKKEFFDYIIQSLEDPQKFSTDFQMLDRLRRPSTIAGRELLKMIKLRKLFKRILVISKKENKELWADFYAMRDVWWTGDRSVALQREFQRQIINHLSKMDKDKLKQMNLEEKVNKIIRWHKSKKILFLIDIPKERIPSHTSLEYLPESHHLEIRESWNKPHAFSESEIWSYLTMNFIELIGKIRIFAHPDIRETIKKAIPQNIREDLLKQSIKNVKNNVTKTGTFTIMKS